MSIKTEKFQEALKCVPFADDIPSLPAKDDFGDPLTLEDGFAFVIADSTVAKEFDWKTKDWYVLESIAIDYAKEFYSEIEIDQTELTLIIEQVDGIEKRKVLQNYQELSRHQLVKEFVELFPIPIDVFILVPFEYTDTTVYLFLNKQQAACLRKILGDDFSQVLLSINALLKNQGKSGSSHPGWF